MWSLDQPLQHQLRKANSQASPQTPESNSGGGTPTLCGDEVTSDSDLMAEAPESEKVNLRNQTDQKDIPLPKNTANLTPPPQIPQMLMLPFGTFCVYACNGWSDSVPLREAER